MALTLQEHADRISKAKDFYEVLGVDKNASADQIKKAFRAAALATHPDKNPVADKGVAEEAFKKLGVANETLSDPVKKQSYDKPPSVGLFEKLKSAITNVCESISNFFSKLTAKQEQTHSNTGPK